MSGGQITWWSMCNLNWSVEKQCGNIIEIYEVTCQLWEWVTNGPCVREVTCLMPLVVSPVTQIPCWWYHPSHFVTLLTDRYRLFTRTNFVRDLLGTVNLCRAIYIKTEQFLSTQLTYIDCLPCEAWSVFLGDISSSQRGRRGGRRELVDIRHLHIWHILSSWGVMAQTFW